MTAVKWNERIELIRGNSTNERQRRRRQAAVVGTEARAAASPPLSVFASVSRRSTADRTPSRRRTLRWPEIPLLLFCFWKIYFCTRFGCRCNKTKPLLASDQKKKKFWISPGRADFVVLVKKRAKIDLKNWKKKLGVGAWSLGESRVCWLLPLKRQSKEKKSSWFGRLELTGGCERSARRWKRQPKEPRRISRVMKLMTMEKVLVIWTLLLPLLLATTAAARKSITSTKTTKLTKSTILLPTSNTNGIFFQNVGFVEGTRGC